MLWHKSQGAGGVGGSTVGTVAYKTVFQDPATSSLNISFTSGWLDASDSSSLSGNIIEEGDLIFILQGSQWRSNYGGTLPNSIPSGYTRIIPGSDYNTNPVQNYTGGIRSGEIQIYYTTVGASVPSSVTMSGTVTSSAYGRIVTAIVCRGVSYVHLDGLPAQPYGSNDPMEPLFSGWDPSYGGYPPNNAGDFIIQVGFVTYSNYSQYPGILIAYGGKDLQINAIPSTEAPYAYQYCWAQWDTSKVPVTFARQDMTFSSAQDQYGGSHSTYMVLRPT
jgi:hypothetical protein